MRKFVIVAVAMFAAFVVVPAAGAVPINVTTTDDLYGASPGSCSLREAITAAQTNATFDGCGSGLGADTLNLPAGEYKITRAGAGENANLTGDFDVTGTDALTIQPSNGEAKVIVNGNSLDRVFDQQGNNSLAINSLTVRNGLLTLIEDGGGIRNATGTLSVDSVTVAGSSSAYSAGGIAVYNALTMVNSTVSGNKSDGNGGGLYMPGGSTATVKSSTITKNIADANADETGDGGGFNDSNSDGVNLTNVILAANEDRSPVTKSPDCYASSTKFFPRYVLSTQALGAGSCLIGFNPGTNILTTDALLGPLQDNEGLTLTHALLKGSPAIGAGGSAGVDVCPAVDQNRRARPVGACDIGAVQYVEPVIPPPPGTVLVKVSKVAPKVLRLKRGKRAGVVSVTAQSTGTAVAPGAKLCLKPTKGIRRALKFRGALCRNLGTLTLTGSRTVKFRISAKKNAKKRTFKVKAVLTATGATAKTAIVTVRVR